MCRPMRYSRRFNGNWPDSGLNLTFGQIPIANDPLKSHLISQVFVLMYETFQSLRYQASGRKSKQDMVIPVLKVRDYIRIIVNVLL
jgi:hypothetical protein